YHDHLKVVIFLEYAYFPPNKKVRILLLTDNYLRFCLPLLRLRRFWCNSFLASLLAVLCPLAVLNKAFTFSLVTTVSIGLSFSSSAICFLTLGVRTKVTITCWIIITKLPAAQ